MPSVIESLTNFLTAKKKSHNAPELLDLWTPDMETQVNVSSGNGEPVEGRRHTWSDGMHEWWNIRIPKNANSDPEFSDYNLDWPLDLHADAIGCTGWDWRNRCSRWVGFDFDSITGHAAGVGVSDEELNRVAQAAKALPFVEVRKSTGGSGLHLYVYLDAIPSANHTEHAALARAVLGTMSSATGFDFAAQIDACGGILWIWHRKATLGNQGLKRLKAAERILTSDDLPANWRDHVEVVTRKRSKVRVNGIDDDKLDPFEALASARKIIALDDDHKNVIDALRESGCSTIWVPDHHLLQTHTKALQNLNDNEEIRKKLKLKGFFKTISAGKDMGTPNCFMFPLLAGGWRVFRFSQGIVEAETWTQDRENWTTCVFNRAPDLASASKALGGAELSDNGGFEFRSPDDAARVIEALGKKVEMPEKLDGREVVLKKNKDGRLLIRVQKSGKGEPHIAPGWASKKSHWERVIDAQAEPNDDDDDLDSFDHVVRALITPKSEDAGWMFRADSGDWGRWPTEKVKFTLHTYGKTDAEIKMILGMAIRRRWKLVSIPFHAEYPGDRAWNLNAAQFRYQPSTEPGPHPSWDLILNHCGHDLTQYLKELDWAKKANIRTGADYLLGWIACMLRCPFEPLPYLFMYGEQNSGKSILHEAIALLMTSGVVRADRALTNSNDFNGELANAVLCVVEEKDISVAGAAAYNKIKDWVTGRTISIRKMRTDSYEQPNTTHWIQCANKREACPIFPGDTRITVIFVPDVQDEIAKSVLIERLEREAPCFLKTLCDLQLPTVDGRLRLPVVGTASKQRAEELARSPLEQFIAEGTRHSEDEKILFSEFYERFREWLPEEERYQWTRHKVSRGLPDSLPTRTGVGNKLFILNVSWKPRAEGGAS